MYVVQSVIRRLIIYRVKRFLHSHSYDVKIENCIYKPVKLHSFGITIFSSSKSTIHWEMEN